MRGSIAKVVLRLNESNVVELHSRIYDVNTHHSINLIRLRFRSLRENVATALLSFPDLRLPDQADLLREFKVLHYLKLKFSPEKSWHIAGLEPRS